MTTHSRIALWLGLATLCSACDRGARQPAPDSATRHPITVSQQSAPPPDSLSLDVAVVRRPQRFGLIHIEKGGAPCLTIEADSLPEGTPIRFVSLNRYESSAAAERIGSAVTVGAPREACADSTRLTEGEMAYHLRVVSGDATHAIGIFGPLDTLMVQQDRAEAVFPGDSAHWHFWTCASFEGLHDRVGRQSADSLIVLWDGYTYLGYDMEGDCKGPRDVAIANATASLVARWQAGHRDRETVMSLLIARWNSCHMANEMPGDGPADADSVTDLPSMTQMLKALGAPNELTPEEDFVIAKFAREDNDCLGKSLGESANGLRAEAARREPSSALFAYFAVPDHPRRGSENAAAAELHRRFEHRGEFYRMFLNEVRDDLRFHSSR